MTQIEKVLYTAKAHTTGGRDGASRSSDGRLDVKLSSPGALSHSLQHELADKGIRVQAVLPGATATDFWGETGFAYQNLPKSIVMSAEEMVDAALVGLDQGERVTIPSLQDGDEWTRFEAARMAISEHLSRSTPASRYRVA